MVACARACFIDGRCSKLGLITWFDTRQRDSATICTSHLLSSHSCRIFQAVAVSQGDVNLAAMIGDVALIGDLIIANPACVHAKDLFGMFVALRAHTFKFSPSPFAIHTVLAVPRSIIPPLTSGTLTHRGFWWSARQTSPQGTGAVHWKSPCSCSARFSRLCLTRCVAVQAGLLSKSPSTTTTATLWRIFEASARRYDPADWHSLLFDKLSQCAALVACFSSPSFLLRVSRGVMTL